MLVDSSGNVDRTNKTAATVFFKYFFINANSGGLWVQKKKLGIFQGHGRLMFLCLFITYVKFFWHTLVTDKTSTWQMKIAGVGSLMFLIAASLLSERFLVFFSAQRYASISTS